MNDTITKVKNHNCEFTVEFEFSCNPHQLFDIDPQHFEITEVRGEELGTTRYKLTCWNFKYLAEILVAINHGVHINAWWMMKDVEAIKFPRQMEVSL